MYLFCPIFLKKIVFYHSNIKKDNICPFFMECALCGISEERAILKDVISRGGIVKLCKKCASEEDFPILKRIGFVPSRAEMKNTVKDVLTRVSGVKPLEKPKEENIQLKQQEEKLKEIADKNVENAIKEKTAPTDDLVDKFHWVIMRARRLKKITQKELGRAIGESEAAIKMVEQGMVSAKSPYLIEKIEKYLGIKLKKLYSPQRFVPESELAQIQTEILGREQELVKQESQELRFDPMATKSLTIADLKEMKQRKEEEVFEKKEERGSEEEWEEKDRKMERDLSDKEIDDLIFGRGQDL